MSQVNPELVTQMRTRLEAVGGVVVDVADMDAAYAYALDLCEKKAPCQHMLSGTPAYYGKESENKCTFSADTRIIAAPALAKKEFSSLGKTAASKNIALISTGLRECLSGIDIAFTIGEFGIASTGSCVLESTQEELRIATMISEIHVMVLKKSSIVSTTRDAADTLTKWQKEGPRYVAFITGPSRTADIERVLAIGVHGPLEFHLLLVEE